MTYTVHTSKTCPEPAKNLLDDANKTLGFVPNLLGIMATSPSLVKAYTTLAALFEETSFSATERQLVLLTVSFENNCEYCMAAHSVIAKMQKVPADIISARRNGESLSDPKLEALRSFTAAVVTSRGWPDEQELRKFNDAGYPVDEGTRKFLWNVIQNPKVTAQAFNALTGNRVTPCIRQCFNGTASGNIQRSCNERVL